MYHLNKCGDIFVAMVVKVNVKTIMIVDIAFISGVMPIFNMA